MQDILVNLAALDPMRLAWIVALTLLGSVVAGLSGMGGGMLVAFAITPIIGIKALVPTIAVAMLINHLARIWVFRQEVRWRPAAAVLAGAAPFTMLGSLVYVALPAEVVAVVMGAFLVLFVPVRRQLDHESWHLGTRGLGLFGIGLGFISGTTVGGGMLVIPALLGAGLAGTALVATDALIGTVILATKAVTFGVAAAITLELAVIGTLIGLCSVPGLYLARMLLNRFSLRIHTVFIEGLILFGGLSFIYRGLTA